MSKTTPERGIDRPVSTKGGRLFLSACKWDIRDSQLPNTNLRMRPFRYHHACDRNYLRFERP